MCGIAGIIDFTTSTPDEALLRRMIGLLRHRGPDASGIYRDDIAGLAHARLSIIDLAGGNQPIHNEDQSVWIIFNGEIFNYPDLREELKSRGHRFYTRSDTEVLVHLYEDYGPEFLHHLNGQFGLALWDLGQKRLLLARDRLGIRPVFYFEKNGRLVFGSEIKSLFADSRIPRALDSQALSDIFTCWAPFGTLTAFEGVRQLLPGHYALFSSSGMNIRPYWQPSFSASHSRIRSLAEWTEELSELLCDAARIRLRADVPVGAYLSGGLDSTYISSLVKRSFNNRLCTFSVGFTDDRFDETPFQERAIEAIQTDHQVVQCSEKDIGEVFPKVIWHTETPILRTAPAPLFMLSGLVRENDFKVVLTGEGADEVFAGYNIFKEDKVRRFWARRPDSKLRPMLLQKLYPYIFSQGDGRARAFLESFFRKNLTQVDSPAYSHLIRWYNTSLLKAFFSDALREKTAKEHEFQERFISTLPTDFMNWDPLSRAQYTEMTIFLSNYLLSSQGDRMAMAHSVEGRFPFLDHRVVEFASTIPPQYRLNGLDEKFILKQVARDLIPSKLWQRPKQPYRAPISRCFFCTDPPDYVEELLSESAIRRAGYFHPQKVSRLIAKCEKQEGHLVSERENMALAGILSTQLLDHMFIRHFPAYPIHEPKDVRVFDRT
ncbi:MAG: asparagine synthase (glutamine-hydrolyzing) [Proteobacteria bacterium]|nr:asparagine synthase (glutamine-hydrolyzing) [Pseudomonadota bacterium]